MSPYTEDMDEQNEFHKHKDAVNKYKKQKAVDDFIRYAVNVAGFVVLVVLLYFMARFITSLP